MKKQMEPTLKTDITENNLVKKLMEFDVMQIFPAGDKQKDPAHTKLQFCVYGTYRWEKMENDGDTDVDVFPYPAFEHLRVTQVSEGEEIPYEPQGTRPFDVPKVFKAIATRALATEIMGTTTEMFQMLFLDEGLRKFVDHFRSEENYVLCISGLPIYRYIVSGNLRERLELNMVTDAFIYYSQYGMFDVLGTMDHRLVSDNEFADNCYLDSVENIRNGTEKLLWGKIPEQHDTGNVKAEELQLEEPEQDERTLEFR